MFYLVRNKTNYQVYRNCRKSLWFSKLLLLIELSLKSDVSHKTCYAVSLLPYIVKQIQLQVNCMIKTRSSESQGQVMYGGNWHCHSYVSTRVLWCPSVTDRLSIPFSVMKRNSNPKFTEITSFNLASQWRTSCFCHTFFLLGLLAISTFILSITFVSLK